MAEGSMPESHGASGVGGRKTLRIVSETFFVWMKAHKSSLLSWDMFQPQVDMSEGDFATISRVT